MANISSEQKLDNFRNMSAMIEDYKKQFSRFPTTKEFEEKLEMSSATVKRYKKVIIKNISKKLLEKYSSHMHIHIEKVMDAINEQSKLYTEILLKSNDRDEKIGANKGIMECHLDAIRMIADSGEYLKLVEDYNVSENGQEHNNRETQEEERIQESIEVILS